MENVPDGQLCHITSSAKDSVNNIRIMKVTEDELLKCNGPPYKLVLIGKEENDCEPLSEESDEEIFETENPDIELNTENFEKDKDVKTPEAIEEVKPRNENFIKRPFNKRYKPKSNQRNRNNYNSSSTRNFNSSSSVAKNYNRSVANLSNNDIDPWLNPPQILNSIPKYPLYHQYPHYSQIMEPCLNTSVNSNNDKPIGLLGDSPSQYSQLIQRNFHSSNQSNRFGRGQNYWNDKYTNNYQCPVQDTPISDQPSHETYYHQNKRWNNHGQKSWKRKHNESKKRKRKNTGCFYGNK